MPNFVYDSSSLAYPKTNLAVLPGGANVANYVIDSNWNDLCQAVVDVRGAIKNGKYFGLQAQPTDPAPSGVTDYLYLTNAGALILKLGVTSIPMVRSTRTINTDEGIDGGGDLSGDLTFTLENISPSPAGMYTKADITVDAKGRVIAATNGTGTGYDSMVNSGSAVTTRTALAVDGVNLFLVDDPGNSRTSLELGDDLSAESLTLTDAGTAALIELGAGQSAAVSPANRGRLIYDQSVQRFKVSANAGSYFELLSTSTGVPSSRTVTAGAGLSGGGALSADITLAVGQGVGITINADDVAVNLTHDFAWTGNHTWNPGTSQEDAIAFLMDQPLSNGVRDSHRLRMRGTSYDGTGHNADWQWFVDMTSNAGASRLVFQRDLDGGGFSDQFSISDAGVLSAPSLAASGLTTGAIPFIGAAGVLSQEATNLFWDGTLDALNTSNLWVKTHAAFAGSAHKVFTAAGQTSDDTPTNIVSLALSDLTLYAIEICVIGRDEAGVARAMYGKRALVYREGGGATLQGTVQDIHADVETAGGLDATIGVSSNNAVVSVVGLAATTMDWVATVRVQAVSTNA